MADNTAAQPKEDVAAAIQAAEDFKGEVIDVEYDGYNFQVNTALLDDVDIIPLIERIEEKHSLSATVEFLHYLIGKDGFDKMKAFFVKRDGRFKMSKMARIYYVIFEKFDPKG
jgi:hypothetical protein